MTHNQYLTLLRQMVGRNDDDAKHTSGLRQAIRLALGQASRKVRLATHEVDVSETLVADTARYDMATTDIDSNVIKMTGFYTESFRTKGRYGIVWADPKSLDVSVPGWLDSSVQSSGTIDYVTLSGYKIATYQPPSSTFISSNPKLYYRGWRQIKKPSVDGTAAGSGEAEWTAEIDFPYDDYHDGFLFGALYWTLMQARKPDEAKSVLREEWNPFLDSLEEINPAEGLGRTQLAPAPQFVEGTVDLDVTRYDYGNDV